MMFSPRRLATALLLSSACILAVNAVPATQSVDDAVARLGDPDPLVREQASRTLREAGASAREALQAAASGDDPEIAAQAKQLLRDVPAGAPGKASDADESFSSILRYRATPAEARRQLINELATTPEGIRALTIVWFQETDPELRNAIFEQLIAELSTATACLLGDGNEASAERLLQAAVDRRTGDSPSAYAAYWLTRGKLDHAIRQWSARGGQQPVDVWAEQVLSALLRAKGDAKAAIAHARAADNEDLLQQTLLWAGEWSQLSTELRKSTVAPQEPREMALLCGADAMAGDGKALDVDVARLIALAQGEQNASAACDILLLIERPDDAVKMLVDQKQFFAAYEILEDRGRFDAAADLLAAHDAEMTEDALLLRGAAAKGFARLGLKKQCREMIQRLAKENAASKFPRVCVALAEAERAIGMNAEAWEQFSAGIELAGNRGTMWYVARAFPPNGGAVDWSGIWNSSMQLNPQRPAKALFDRIRQAYEGTLPLEDLSKAVSSVNLNNQFAHPYVELVWEVARRMKAEGREADAVKFVELLAQPENDGALYIHLGDWAVEKQDWHLAASRYQTAWKQDRAAALPLYLQGWAMERGGQAGEGRNRMILAHMIALGDESRRAELARGLLDRGLDDAAVREADVLIRTANPLSSSAQEALRAAATHADDHRDFAIAAALWQRVVIDYLTGSYWFESHAQYMHLPTAIRQSRARAMIAAADFAGADREIKTCLELLPIDSSIVIDVVPELDKAGKHAEADALFDKMFGIQEALCQKYPESAYHHNECAWLAARCERQPAKALAHARRAVELSLATRHGPNGELDPRSVDVIDTLAETYFQNGDVQQAIIEEKKCVALAPAVTFHRKQLARFESKARGGS